MAVNKVVYEGRTLIDLTGDTVSASFLLEGDTAHDKTGAQITGTMRNNACMNAAISTIDQEVTIPSGFHDGSGMVFISSAEQAKLIPSNILKGVTVLGVEGTLDSAGSVTSQAKTVTPTSEDQVITPDSTYDYLSKVTVSAIPYEETSNSAGGTTVTIAGG